MTCLQCGEPLELHPEDRIAVCFNCGKIFPLLKCLAGFPYCLVCGNQLEHISMPDFTAGEKYWLCPVCSIWWDTETLVEAQGEFYIPIRNWPELP